MPIFGAQSLKVRDQLHPFLRQLADEAIKKIDFKILDATRGRAAQEKAFALGHSKVHFGDSAHNWVPAVAMDLFPAPYDWDNRDAFIALSNVVLPLAKTLGIPIRWGGDWNGDGNLSDGWDMPHYELNPWRTYANRDSKLFED
jgi:peptidoglycan L-alanyl-D-glutamate endopeptidase CwlK